MTSYQKYGVFAYIFFMCLVFINCQTPGSCIEDITNDTAGMLESPKFPYPMTSKQICKWSFNISDLHNETLVYVTVLQLEFSDEDIFTISDGITAEKTYNGSNVPRTNRFILSSSNSFIRIQTGENTTTLSPRRFLASYTTLDDPFFTTEHNGVIMSPQYSSQDKTINMSWVITKKPETSIYLSFKSFNIKAGSLVINYNEETLNFTGSTIPNDLPIPADNVHLTLQLSLSLPNQSFELYHSQLHPDCSKVIAIVNSTELNVTFNEPINEYPVKCFVIIEAPENSVMRASVKPEKSKEYNETNTFILLNDGGSRLSPNLLLYSPSTLLEDSSPVLTSTNRLWIGYSSKPLREPITLYVTVDLHNSGKSLYGSDSFDLPKRNNETLVSNTSVYLLTVKSDEQVVAKVSPNTTLHAGNEILFFDGTSYDKILVNFTVNSTFFPIVASGNELLVVAKNFTGNDTFSASFDGYPKGRNVLNTGKVGSYQLTSVNPNSTYLWIISPTEVNSSDVIAVTFNSIDLNDQRTLTIYDGVGDNANILFRPFTFTKRFVVHNAAEKGLKVILQNNGTGFLGVVVDASYEMQKDCVLHLNLTNKNGTTITSPGYPGEYPVNANCTWNITANKRIILSFEDLNLPESRPLLVYSAKDPQTLLANVSGIVAPDDIITDELPVLILFQPQSILNTSTISKGFKINILTLDCGGKYDETKHGFNTPSYPDPEKLPMLCVWSLTVPEKKDTNVQIISMSYSNSKIKSNSAQLTIYEGGSLLSQTANMSAINQTNFLSRTNKLVIKYLNINDSNPGTAYRFNYTTYQCNTDQLCKNGICMHPSWRCNNVNDCGDFSDELACAGSTIFVTPANGVSVATFVVVMFLAFFIGIGVAIGGPILWRKFRTNSSYQEFRNTADA